VKPHVKLAAFLCLALFVGVPGFAQGPGADTFKSQCAPCHGADGTGNTPVGKALKAASFKDPAIVKTPDAALMSIVKNGKDKMPSFGAKLTDDQIKAVVAYIRTLEK
jgi:mono/diheme cytochrome c family protein